MRFWILLISISLLLGCQSNPPSSLSQTLDSAPEPGALYQQGRELYDRADYQYAVHRFLEAIEINPNYADAYFWLGNAYVKLHDTQRAIRAYQDCLHIQPGHADANLGIAILYFERLEFVPAEGYCKRAIDSDPGNHLGYFYLAEIYKRQNQCKQPRELYRKALSIRPDFYEAQVGLREVEQHCAKGSGPVQRPRYEKQDTFGGGGRALKPGEW